MAYGFHTPVTIQSSKVEANHANFPFPIVGTYDGTGGEADLRTVANDGHIENTVANGGASGSLTVPADFVVAPNDDGSSPYDFEFEKYDPATGEIVVWVKIPTMDSASDKTIYMVYSDADVTTSQENVVNVWSNGYSAVWHLAESTGTFYDSTSNGNDSSAESVTSRAVAGQVGDSAHFAESDSGITFPDSASLDLTGSVTVMALANLDISLGSHSSPYPFLVAKSNDTYRLGDYSGSDPDMGIRFDNNAAQTGYTYTESGVWRTWTGVYESGGTSYVRIYEDTIEKNSVVASITNTATDAKDVVVGGIFDGKIDEVRLASVARSENWVKTTSNSFDVSTFLSFGSETTSIQSVIQSVMLGANF